LEKRDSKLKKHQNNMINKLIKIAVVILAFSFQAKAQFSITSDKVSYETPKDYEIGGITVEGVVNYDSERIISLSGLRRGEKITVPGDDITQAIRRLWDQKLFSDIKIFKIKITDETIFLKIQLKERKRLSRYKIIGATKSQTKSLKESINLYSGMVVTEALLDKTKFICTDYFIEKGYLNTETTITRQTDTLVNNSDLMIVNIKKGNKVKVNKIIIEGNEVTEEREGISRIFGKEKKVFSDGRIKRQFKDTKEKKWWRLWKRSKFMKEEYKEGKANLIAKYNAEAMRDAKIVFDTIYKYNKSTIDIKVKIEEGDKYYFRNINWIGNVKYSSGKLDTILGIKKGDEYNSERLYSKLNMSQTELDISSLYMDQGYLFFQINPVEKTIENDSIDIDILIYEGKQARINNVTVVGNTKTNDHVILREIRTKPGELFNRSDIIRTQRELSQLGYFDPQAMGVNPKPNPAEGTVDIEYQVAEKPSDQIELSGGWGGNQFVGSLGLSFTNFSIKNIGDKKSWTPLPSGDGQRLSIRGSANIYFQSLSFSITEPWFGGKKPTSFSYSAYYSLQKLDPTKRSDPSTRIFDVFGTSVGLGTRLKWPDDYFTIYGELGYEYYTLRNYNLVDDFSNGFANNLSASVSLSRNSLEGNPIYPTGGSSITATFKTTAPYSFFDGIDDYSGLTNQEKFKWIEYNKIKFVTNWYTPLTKGKNKMVFHTSVGFGFLSPWSAEKGVSPFERFYYGGSGLTGFRLAGREYIALRGYDDNSISSTEGDALLTKYKMELRYPISLNPSATVFVLGFAEAGNSWSSYKDYNPFQVKKSAGFGLRLFLPMFGLIGLDYGWGLDPLSPGDAGYLPSLHDKSVFKPTGQFHFTIGMNIGEL
jgi:outer membrane protein insertion porin family